MFVLDLPLTPLSTVDSRIVQAFLTIHSQYVGDDELESQQIRPTRSTAAA